MAESTQVSERRSGRNLSARIPLVVFSLLSIAGALFCLAFFTVDWALCDRNIVRREVFDHRVTGLSPSPGAVVVALVIGVLGGAVLAGYAAVVAARRGRSPLGSPSPRPSPWKGEGDVLDGSLSAGLAAVARAMLPALLALGWFIFRAAGGTPFYLAQSALILAVAWCAARLAGLWPTGESHAEANGQSGRGRRNALAFGSRLEGVFAARVNVPLLVTLLAAILFAGWLYHYQWGLYLGYRLAYYDVGVHADILEQTLRGRFMYWNGLEHPGRPPYPSGGTFFAMHFEPTWLLVLPIYAVMRSVGAVFAAGAAALAAGGVGVFYLTRQALGRPWLAVGAALAWFAYPGVTSQVYAGGYGVQPIVLVLPFMLFSFYALLRGRTAAFFVLMALALLTHEAAAVAYAGVGLFVVGLTLRRWRLAAVMTALSVVYFLISVLLLPRVFGVAGFMRESLYAELGGSAVEMLRTVFLKPALVWPRVVNLQALLFVLALVGGLGYAPLRRPRVLLAAVAPVALILLMDNRDWSSEAYWHQAPVLPVLFLAAVLGANERRQRMTSIFPSGGRAVVAGMLAGALVAGYLSGHLPFSKPAEAMRDPQADRLDDIRFLRDLIPRDAALTASDRIALFFTDQDRLFTVKDRLPQTEYVIIDFHDKRTAVTTLRRTQRALMASGQYGLCYVGDQVVAYRKGLPTEAGLDQVRVETIPSNAVASGGNVGFGIRLVAYTVTSVGPDVYEVANYWQAEGLVAEDLLFVCPFAIEGQMPRHQTRGRFMGRGAYPTDLWRPGEIVRDQFIVRFPPSAVSGPRTGRVAIGPVRLVPFSALRNSRQ
jgi:uncharacterized membrane protein